MHHRSKPALCATLLLCALAGVARPSIAASMQAPARELLQTVSSSRPLLFGELHGTREAPAFVAAVMSEASATMPVLLGLEIAASEQDRIDAFLASEGDAAATASLISGAFWGNASQDGRSSIAMLRLLDSARALRAAGRNVAGLAFDCPAAGNENRDAAMARCIDVALQSRPDARALILTGNYHARLAVGAPWDAALEFTGVRLLHRKPVSIDLSAHRGSAWMCTPECGIKQLATRDGDVPTDIHVRVEETADKRGYFGEVRFPEFTASLPAVQAMSGTAGEDAAQSRQGQPAPAPANAPAPASVHRRSLQSDR